MNIHDKKSFCRKGQSLVESVVAIAVVILIVSGLIVAVISSLHSSQSSRARSTATKLTQTGIEAIRNLRDGGWTQFITFVSPVAWCLDESGNPLPPNDIDSSCPQIITGGVSFDRRVLITADVFPPEKTTIKVTVTWTEGQTPKVSEAETYLSKWR